MRKYPKECPKCKQEPLDCSFWLDKDNFYFVCTCGFEGRVPIE